MEKHSRNILFHIFKYVGRFLSAERSVARAVACINPPRAEYGFVMNTVEEGAYK